MNRTLIILGLILILGGIGTGLFALSIFGILLLIPGLVSGRPPVRPAPAQTTQAPRRISPPVMKKAQESGGPSATHYLAPSPEPQQPTNYSPALFPLPILPSLATMGNPIQPMKPAEQKSEPRDEVLEVGAIIALIRLLA